uniref:Reverse transcriptase domain-containing protein n=1 Tax=Tanacetum cinerariifolium TaxID=118510 RepID=A0A6L2JH89_TANCI|nr:reverse transcriptase domain-containing protein [Tanacetum cinerariifolium]
MTLTLAPKSARNPKAVALYPPIEEVYQIECSKLLRGFSLLLEWSIQPFLGWLLSHQQRSSMEFLKLLPILIEVFIWFFLKVVDLIYFLCSTSSLKRILKRTVGENRASWSKKLKDVLWAFRTAYKTPIGCTPYKLVYGKSCHLPIELEYKAYWALKHSNFDLKTTGDHRKLQLNEPNELRDQAYDNSLIYKEKTKKLYDSKIKNGIFNVGDRVLLFNSHLKIFSGKLKTRWTGPFTIAHVFPYGTIELSQADGQIPSGEIKVHIKVLSVLWGNRLPIQTVYGRCLGNGYDKSGQNRSKTDKISTGMKRVQEIKAEGKFISNLIPLIPYAK